MSITSPIPVLQGRGATALSAESDVLVLDRPGEELSIPFIAIAGVHVERRSVTVELRAPVGARPSVHRSEDVSEAAATAFADAVNARLPERTEEIDGAALVVLRTLTPSRRETFMRRLKWFVSGCLGVVVALCVVAGIAGDAGLAIALVPIGAITTTGLGVGAYCVWTWNRERRLLKHGITVVAAQANRPAMYLYTDTAGTTRVLSHLSFEPYVRASYNPKDPSDVLVPQAPFMRRLNITLGGFILFCGLNGVALLAFMIVDTLSGGRP